MQRILAASAIFMALSLPLPAQEWSLGVGSGAFVFGNFLEQTIRLGHEEPHEPVTMILSAAARPGLSVDIERSLGERWAVRAEGTFTRSPLSVKERGTDDYAIDAGDLDVTTFMLPVVFRINPRGAFRVHIHGGPAYAIYRSDARENVVGLVPLFRGTRSRFGGAYGGGVAWWLRDRFAIEGNLTDIVTSSPFEREELPDVPGIRIPRPHNVHTTVGVRWRF